MEDTDIFVHIKSRLHPRLGLIHFSQAEFTASKNLELFFEKKNMRKLLEIGNQTSRLLALSIDQV